MTALERECLEVLRIVIDQVAAGRPLKRLDFMELVGRMRDTVKHLENKESGCPTGLHGTECECEEDKPSTAYRRKKKLPGIASV